MAGERTEAGHKTRKHVAGDGIRRYYYEAMKDYYFTYPRKLPSRHSVQWYLDGHLVNRPTFGIYALSRFAEHLLRLTKRSKRNQGMAYHDAVVFFAETRRSMQNILSGYPINRDLRGKEVEAARRAYLRLLEHAVIAAHAVMEDTKIYYRPIGKLNQADNELLAAILYEQSRNGTIPPTSALYRKLPS